MKCYRMSHHACERADEMDVTCDEISQTLVQPDLTYPNCPGHPAGTTFVRRRLAVPVASDGTILTILWNGKDGR